MQEQLSLTAIIVLIVCAACGCGVIIYAALQTIKIMKRAGTVVDTAARRLEEGSEGLFNVTVNVQPVIVTPVPKEPKALDKGGLVCGHCHNPIRSKPIRGTAGENGNAKVVYKCETCSKEVVADPPK